jgi:pheromone a factor receptor
MSLSILAIYLPFMLYYLVINIQDTLSAYKTYDYGRIRRSPSPYPWNTILFVPSWIIPSAVMNQPWIPIATTVAIVAFFGNTFEAREMYCQYAESIGLGTCCMTLRQKKDAGQNYPVGTSGETRYSGRKILSNGNNDFVEP